MKTLGRQIGVRDEREGVLQRDHVFVLVLLLIVVAVYGQTVAFAFLIWDDPIYVLGPPASMGLTTSGAKSAFTSQMMTHWHPLTVLSHMLDVELFGLSSGAHHGVSVLVHMLNSLLLFALLRSTTRAFWPSAFVTVVWAVHPLHVENVAWVSDRKDLLCAFFGLLALHAYVRFAWCRGLRWYGLALLLYLMGLLSKSMIVTLPLMCLLLDMWPLQRFGLDAHVHAESGPNDFSEVARQRYPLFRLCAEKTPLFVVALGFILLTYATTQRAGALEYYGRADFWDRLANSLCSHAWYTAKTIWPSGLAGLFVHPNLPGGTPWKAWQIAGSICVLGSISWMVWRLRRPYLIMGWLWFLGTLAPVNGLVQYGNLSRAGRCMYLPMIGLLVMIAWGVGELLQCYLLVRRHAGNNLVAGVASSIVLVLGAACWVEARYWRNDRVFFERQMELVPNNPYYNHNLAVTYYRLGEYEKARYHADKAVAIWPMIWQAHDLLAKICAHQGDTELSSHHRTMASDIKANAAYEHRRWIFENAFAATADGLLGEH